MLRPGLHFGNACAITPADKDIVRRWAPLSLLLAMGNIVAESAQDLRECWDQAGRCPIVLRQYYYPREGGSVAWATHAMESVELARRCIEVGIPAEFLILKPFNEPNMPRWAQWEGFGPKESDMIRYNKALDVFINVAKNEIPELRIGGPHLTVGNRDVKFSTDPPAVYYYHGEDGKFESSPCAPSLRRLDCHFVHCYGMHPGEYQDRAHGLRFLEYEKYLSGKPLYIVEGAFGINSGQPIPDNTVRGEETVKYLKLVGDRFPQVEGIALWVGGDRGWFAFRHSEGGDPGSHRPVVYAVEKACQEEPPEEPQPPPPSEGYSLVKGIVAAGIPDMVDLRNEIESFSDLPHLQRERRDFGNTHTHVVHHSGYTDPHTPLTIARWHVLEKEGDKDPTIPYHFCIDQDGRLYFTARLVWTTYHTGVWKFNRRSVGTCLLGDFSTRHPTAAQVLTLRRLVYALNQFYGGGWGEYRQLYVVPHNYLTDTVCPGLLVHDFVWSTRWPSPPF